MKLLKYLGFILLWLFVVPGVAFGAVSLYLQHPGQVTVGDTFQVTVRIFGDSPSDPANICGFQTLIGYNDTKLEMMAYQDDHFFAVSDMGGTCIYTPIGTNCGVPSDPGQFGAMDLSQTTPVPWNYMRPTATYTFKALEAGTFQFFPIATRNEVSACDFERIPLQDDIINGRIIVTAVNVPTLSQYGMVVFMLAMVLCAFVFMKRRRNVQL